MRWFENRTRNGNLKGLCLLRKVLLLHLGSKPLVTPEAEGTWEMSDFSFYSFSI